MSSRNAKLVSVTQRRGASYPVVPPFHPDRAYPEYGYPGAVSREPNEAYELVREALAGLGLDAARVGTPEWNPMGDLVGPGATILIKPNLVLDRHPRGGDLRCLITHGSVVRAVLDYAIKALKGRGRIVIGDAPLQTTDFGRAVEESGLKAVADFCRPQSGLDIQVVDFRKAVAVRDEWNHILSWGEAPGDPAGNVTFDLGNESLLAPLGRDSPRFRVANYPRQKTLAYHSGTSHRYVVARSALDADLIVSVPKMKTHCKVGVTLGLKNFVGIVGRKECLAHHREGGSGQGRDEYPSSSRLKQFSTALEQGIDGREPGFLREALKLAYRINERLIRTLRIDPLRDGSWYGNDTAWRMTLDLVRIALYGTPEGVLADKPQRQVLTVMDGIVAGEGEGPLEATPKDFGTVVACVNPVAGDLVAAKLMGFDYSKIPLLRNATVCQSKPLALFLPSDVRVRINGAEIPFDDVLPSDAGLILEAPVGWKGHLELDRFDFHSLIGAAKEDSY